MVRSKSRWLCPSEAKPLDSVLALLPAPPRGTVPARPSYGLFLEPSLAREDESHGIIVLR